ncbi:HAD family hydrolase [Mycoplasmatota bacterium]|nr:HAD family hydrolase [Mycoplasmatota bacterium]
MIKHIFCDLDGTLLKDFNKILDEDIKALQAAQEKGLTVSIATGRLDYEIKMIMNKYQLKGYRISQNGAVVFDELNQLVYEKSISNEDTLTILKALKGYHIVIFFQTADAYIVEEKIPLIVEFEKSQSLITYNENKNILKELDKHQFISISIWAEEDHNIEIKKQLDKVLPPHLVSYVSSKYTLDITDVENSKGNGIKQICEKNKISLNEIAVIGDSQNDLSMFNITDNSYVMDEADVEVKKHAQFCVESVKHAVFDILNNR